MAGADDAPDAEGALPPIGLRKGRRQPTLRECHKEIGPYLCPSPRVTNFTTASTSTTTTTTNNHRH